MKEISCNLNEVALVNLVKVYAIDFWAPDRRRRRHVCRRF